MRRKGVFSFLFLFLSVWLHLFSFARFYCPTFGQPVCLSACQDTFLPPDLVSPSLSLSHFFSLLLLSLSFTLLLLSLPPPCKFHNTEYTVHKTSHTHTNKHTHTHIHTHSHKKKELNTSAACAPSFLFFCCLDLLDLTSEAVLPT